jgi:hypothetical protein
MILLDIIKVEADKTYLVKRAPNWKEIKYDGR